MNRAPVLMVLLAAATFVSAIAVVVTQHEARRLFAENQELEGRRDDLNEEWGRLQLEQSTWATDDRIERIARTRLHMEDPAGGSRILVQP